MFCWLVVTREVHRVSREVFFSFARIRVTCQIVSFLVGTLYSTVLKMSGHHRLLSPASVMSTAYSIFATYSPLSHLFLFPSDASPD